MKRNILLIPLSILMLSLSACGGKDKPDETKPTLEVIKPTETEAETVPDKLDDPVKELEIHGVYVGPDGEQMSADEFHALEESIRYENSPMLQAETGSDESSTTSAVDNSSTVDNNSDTDSNNNSSSNNDNSSQTANGDTSLNSENVTSYVEPTLSESEIAEGQRDFTDEEYEAIQNSIDEYTLKEAQDLMLNLDWWRWYSE